MSFDTLGMSDILVVPGDYDLFADDPAEPDHWVVFASVGSGSRTLQAEVEDCCDGTYGVDYTGSPPHGRTDASGSLSGMGDTEGLSLRMSQVAGPNDGMFFVMGNGGVSTSSYRYVHETSLGMMLGFGEGFSQWESWTTWGGWETSCTRSGYMNPDTSSPTYSCTSTGAVFVR